MRASAFRKKALQRYVSSFGSDWENERGREEEGEGEGGMSEKGQRSGMRHQQALLQNHAFASGRRRDLIANQSPHTGHEGRRAIALRYRTTARCHLLQV